MLNLSGTWIEESAALPGYNAISARFLLNLHRGEFNEGTAAYEDKSRLYKLVLSGSDWRVDKVWDVSGAHKKYTDSKHTQLALDLTRFIGDELKNYRTYNVKLHNFSSATNSPLPDASYQLYKCTNSNVPTLPSDASGPGRKLDVSGRWQNNRRNPVRFSPQFLGQYQTNATGTIPELASYPLDSRAVYLLVESAAPSMYESSAGFYIHPEL